MEQLAAKRSPNTSLISYYVKGDGPNLTNTFLQKELSSAENIKSKQTRKEVISALKALQRTCKTFTKIPENGLCLFADSEQCV